MSTKYSQPTAAHVPSAEPLCVNQTMLLHMNLKRLMSGWTPPSFYSLVLCIYSPLVPPSYFLLFFFHLQWDHLPSSLASNSADLECLTPMLLSPSCKNFRCIPELLVEVVLGIEPRTIISSSDKHFNQLNHSPSHLLYSQESGNYSLIPPTLLSCYPVCTRFWTHSNEQNRHTHILLHLQFRKRKRNYPR